MLFAVVFLLAALQVASLVDYLPWYLSLAGLPIATGVAILRYRLYDIDRIINRTLVYALLTVVLGGVYGGLAVGVGSVAGSNASSLVIAGSTLVVAALFRPARR